MSITKQYVRGGQNLRWFGQLGMVLFYFDRTMELMLIPDSSYGEIIVFRIITNKSIVAYLLGELGARHMPGQGG